MENLKESPSDATGASMHPIVPRPIVIEPYYKDESVTIYNADCRQILPFLDRHDLVITDPPYSEVTHAGARTTEYKGEKDGGKKSIHFNSVDADFLREIFGMCKPKRWCITFIDWRHVLPLELRPPEGLEFIRFGVWTKLNPMPQLTGDRPGTGWEAIAILHPPGKKQWNGVSKPAVWSHGTSRYGNFGPSKHPTEKPLGLIQKLIADFTKEGETIVDPFAGSGTTGHAAKLEGRKATLIEINEEYCEKAADRLRQGVLF